MTRLVKYDDMGYWIQIGNPSITDRTDDRRNKTYHYDITVPFIIFDTKGNAYGNWMERENRATAINWQFNPELKIEHGYADRFWGPVPEGWTNNNTLAGDKPIVSVKRLKWRIKASKPSDLPPKDYSELSQEAVKSRLDNAYADWEDRVARALDAIRDNLDAAIKVKEAEKRVNSARYLLSELAKEADTMAREAINWETRLNFLVEELKECQQRAMSEKVGELSKDPYWEDEKGERTKIDLRVLGAVEKHAMEALPPAFPRMLGLGTTVDIKMEDVS